jgi:predicted PurR-regulated permease PerM
MINLRPRNALPVDMLLRILAIALLLIACIEVLSPFIGPLTWAGIIAVSTWPAFKRLCSWLGGRQALAATLLVLALSAALILPLLLLALSLADSVPAATALANNLANMKLPPPPHWLSTVPFFGPSLTDAWQSSHSDISGLFVKLKPYIDQAAYWAVGQGAQLGKSLLMLILAMVISGFFLVYGDAGWITFENILARVGGKLGGNLPELIARTIRSVTNGVVGTALVQALLTVIGLVICSVPGAVILGFLCFIIAVSQLPTMFVWAPAAVWLFYGGHSGFGIFLVLWGILVVNMVENVLKPYLISHGSGLPLPLIFLGVIGGLLTWGLIGLFIGPTALAVGYTLFNFWLQSEPPTEPTKHSVEPKAKDKKQASDLPQS